MQGNFTWLLKRIAENFLSLYEAALLHPRYNGCHNTQM